MNLKPLSDRLVIKPLEQEEQTASGILLPETAKEKPQTGQSRCRWPRRPQGDRGARLHGCQRW